MFNIIENNPFRVLGVYSNASIKEITANKSKAAAYVQVGKSAEFKADFNRLLQSVVRDENSIQGALSSINLPINKLNSALFWFIQASDVDEIAFNHLQVGGIEKAKEILNKRVSFSSLINRGVLSMIEGNYHDAIACITEVIHNVDYRSGFVEQLLGANSIVTEEELAHVYIETLMKELPTVNWIEVFNNSGKSSGDKEYIVSLTISPCIKEIENLISKTASADKDDPEAIYEAGVELMDKTKTSLKTIKDIVGEGDVKYQIIADKLAKKVLQCGINYFNNSHDPHASKDAMKLQKYALSIAVGKMIKERCRENVNILQEIINELAPEVVLGEDAVIRDFLDEYNKLPNRIDHAIDLIKHCAFSLVTIKERLGKDNSFYIKLSTLIVNVSLHNIIEEVNSSQKEGSYLATGLDLGSLRIVVKKAWHATLYLDKFDLERKFKIDRYDPNRRALESLMCRLGVYCFDPSTSDVDLRTEGEAFNECKTIQDFKNYLSQYPAAFFFNEARQHEAKQRIVLLEEEKNFYERCSSISDFEGYLSRYPKGIFMNEAKQQKSFLEEKNFYMRCLSEKKYKSYLSRYPKGKYVKEIQDLKASNSMFIGLFVIVVIIVLITVLKVNNN